MAGTSEKQRRIVLNAAIATAALLGLQAIIAVIAGIVNDELNDAVGWFAFSAVLAAVPFLPLAFKGVFFRIAAAAIGLTLFVFGVALLMAIVGLVLIVAGVADLFAAAMPSGASRAAARPR